MLPLTSTGSAVTTFKSNNSKITVIESGNYPDGSCYLQINTSESYANIDAFKDDMRGTVIQYETATSYTEQVIDGQPLNTLPQDGEQWVREEWEKGLNLADNKDNSFSDWYVDFYAYLEPNKNYTFTLQNINFPANSSTLSVNGQMQYDYGTMGSPSEFHITSPTNITTKTRVLIRFEGNYTTLDKTDFMAMLVEGSHPYPYQHMTINYQIIL